MRVIPNTLNVDFANLRHEIGWIPEVDGMHVDVMDNHLVPNLTTGFPVVECLRKVTDQLLDTHLMIEDPNRWASAYVEVGVESVTFHVEAVYAPIWLVRELQARGARALMVLKPATPIEPYTEMSDGLDMVLFMTVEPGFGGQKFPDLVLPKTRRTRGLVGGHPIWLQIDGGVSAETIGRCVEAGTDTFVAGSAVYNVLCPDAMVWELRGLADPVWYY